MRIHEMPNGEVIVVVDYRRGLKEKDVHAVALEVVHRTRNKTSYLTARKRFLEAVQLAYESESATSVSILIAKGVVKW